MSVRSSKDDDMKAWATICKWLSGDGDGEIKKGIRALAYQTSTTLAGRRQL